MKPPTIYGTHNLSGLWVNIAAPQRRLVVVQLVDCLENPLGNREIYNLLFPPTCITMWNGEVYAYIFPTRLSPFLFKEEKIHQIGSPFLYPISLLPNIYSNGKVCMGNMVVHHTTIAECFWQSSFTTTSFRGWNKILNEWKRLENISQVEIFLFNKLNVSVEHMLDVSVEHMSLQQRVEQHIRTIDPGYFPK